MLNVSAQPTEIEITYSDWTINVPFYDLSNYEISADSGDFSQQTDRPVGVWLMWTAEANDMWNAVDSELMWR